MLISLMALSPQRKLHSGLSGQIKLAIYGLLSLALTLQKKRHLPQSLQFLFPSGRRSRRPILIFCKNCCFLCCCLFFRASDYEYLGYPGLRYHTSCTTIREPIRRKPPIRRG
ncbi:hypothetical protein [Candidatus Regiella endosymbiont of Tuberolachnus salignus]|uniref:hypothetical protein n=1 Tax=Candidatus Regiella endosymbiont of Tuberolachnus salignus TaxID=3077956 RepID=UPI0030D0114C